MRLQDRVATKKPPKRVALTARQLQEFHADLTIAFGGGLAVCFAIWAPDWKLLLLPLGMIMVKIAGGRYDA